MPETLVDNTKSQHQDLTERTGKIQGQPLPSPLDLPTSDVVIFDGQCAFCQQQVQRLHRWDGKNRLSFISLHDALVAERFPDLSHDELMQQMYVVTRRGQRFAGAAAFRFLTRRLPRLWILAPLLHIPFSLPLWQWGYRQIAKRRYKISQKMRPDCQSGNCKIHFD
jgi:predicted DCC family thiol-disulfide oxidoreductase YuxK